MRLAHVQQLLMHGREYRLSASGACAAIPHPMRPATRQRIPDFAIGDRISIRSRGFMISESPTSRLRDTADFAIWSSDSNPRAAMRDAARAADWRACMPAPSRHGPPRAASRVPGQQPGQSRIDTDRYSIGPSRAAARVPGQQPGGFLCTTTGGWLTDPPAWPLATPEEKSLTSATSPEHGDDLLP